MSGSAYRVDSTTQKLGWDSKLRMEAGVQDVFSDFSGIYTDQTKDVGNAITVKVKAEKGEHNRTITLMRPLSGGGVQGRDSQMGAEETQLTRSLKVYANTYSNGVVTETYGIDNHDASYLDVIGEVQPQESRWHKEIEGKHIREALVENVSSNLEAAPTSLSAGINSNVLVLDEGIFGSTKITYSSTALTYATAIGTATDLSTPDSTNRYSQITLNHIIYQAQLNEIEQINIGGKATWILTVPSRQKINLFAPGTSGFSKLVEQTDVRGPGNRALSYILGRYGPLLLVEDPRSPVAVIDATTFTPGYKGPGTTDGRTLAAGNNNFDVGMLLGKGSVYEFEAQQLAFKEEVQDYEKTRGIAAVRTTGWVSGVFDATTPTDTSIVNKSSMLIIAGSN